MDFGCGSGFMAVDFGWVWLGLRVCLGFVVAVLVVICVVVFSQFGFLAVVMGGCSWLASCYWVVMGGCSWLAVVVVCVIDRFMWCFLAVSYTW